MSALEKFIKVHRLTCNSRTFYNDGGTGPVAYPCNCGHDKAAEELAALQARVKELEDVIKQMGQALKHVDDHGLCQYVQPALEAYERMK